LIQIIGAGDVLGWSWLFPPFCWHFDARAVKPTEAIFIYGTRVRELCDEDHDLGYELMKRTAEVVIRRLQATRRHLLGQTANPLPTC
jgi:CRP/FNR family cyclic AMP-dependent transcriptional regulator